MDVKQLAKNKYVWIATGGGIFVIWFLKHRASTTSSAASTDTATQGQAQTYSDQGYIPVGDPYSQGNGSIPGEYGAVYGQESPSEIIGNLGTLLQTLGSAGLITLPTGGGAPVTPVGGVTTAPPPASPGITPPPAPAPQSTTITCPVTYPHKACDTSQGSCCYKITNLRCVNKKWVHDHVYMDGRTVTVPRGDSCG